MFCLLCPPTHIQSADFSFKQQQWDSLCDVYMALRLAYLLTVNQLCPDCMGQALVCIPCPLRAGIPRIFIGRTSWEGGHRRKARTLICISICFGSNSPNRTPVTCVVWRDWGWWRREGRALVWVDIRGRQTLSHYSRGGGRCWSRQGDSAAFLEITASVSIGPVLLVVVHNPVRISFLIRRPSHRVGWERAIEWAVAPVCCLAAIHLSHAMFCSSIYTIPRVWPIPHCTLIACTSSVPCHVAAVTGTSGKTVHRSIAATVIWFATEVRMITPAATPPAKSQGIVSIRLWLWTVVAILVKRAFFGPVAFLPATITTRSVSHSRRSTQAASRKLHAHQFALKRKDSIRIYTCIHISCLYQSAKRLHCIPTVARRHT